MSDVIYQKLREFMHGLPGGFPATETGVEIRILKKLYSAEEAELTMQLQDEPESLPEIAERTGLDETSLAEKLEDMAQKGLIYRVRKGEERHYQAFQFLVGVYEFQLKSIDREFVELFEEYLPYYGIGMSDVKTSQMRTIPIASAVDLTADVATYNNVRDLIKEKDFISVQECICRKEQALLDNECDYPKEICIGFGDFARYYVDNSMGRQINLEETNRLLDKAEEAGLVLRPTNSQDVDGICCCCSCCCPSLRFAKMMERPIDLVNTPYISRVNPEQCTGCEECVERCPMDAIRMENEQSIIFDTRCIGCGVCIPACPDEAISLELRPDAETPPPDFKATLQQIKSDRGL